MKDWERYSIDSLTRGETDQRGRLFLSPRGQHNHANIRILHSGVDTVRQLYSGVPCRQLFDRIIETYHQGRGATIDLWGTTWIVAAGTSSSGFRYRLQNNDLGVIVLFYARHVKSTNAGTHLKIELSPRFIHEHGAEHSQRYMHEIASHLLANIEPAGCAVHLALDVQGWEPPTDFMDRFVTRSKRIVRHNAISDIEITSGEVATQYGKGQSYLFGSAGALQCAIYNKTSEAKYRDKLHFWQSIWSDAVRDDDPCQPAYDPDRDVWRIEFRFHQSVLREFAQGTPCNVDTGECLDMHHGFARFVDTIPHLTGLWRSALQTYRLDHCRDLIDSAWQLFRDDARFFSSPPDLLYKRARRKPGQGGDKNICLVVGNLLSMYARNGFTVAQSVRGLMQCGVWDDIAAYYRRRGIDLSQLREIINRGLIERRLLGNAA